jgi:hypothetical protein
MTGAHLLWTAVTLTVSTGNAGAASVPDLIASTDLSDTGHYRISWEVSDENTVVELQESLTANFTEPIVIYEGLDRSSVLSGRLDGTYHYRARAAGGPWSQPVAVTVRHHSVTGAFLFLAMGAVVFLATAVLIVVGQICHKREIASEP